MKELLPAVRALAIAAVVAGMPSLLGAATSPGLVTPPAALAHVSADRIARLTAAGLQVDDPQLNAKLAALANARKRPASLLPVKFPKVSDIPAISAFSQAGSAAAGATLGGGPAGPPAISSVTVIPGMSVAVKGTNLADAQKYATPALSISNCAVPALSLFGGQPAPALNRNGPLAFLAVLAVPEDEPSQIAVSLDGTTSNAAAFTYKAVHATDSGGNMNVGVGVGDVAPYYLSPDYLNQTASTFSTSANHLSTDFSGPTISGTDTLGIGTFVVNGWQVTATINGVHSYLDAPGNNGSNDVFRSATISQQPASGRLETKIAWQMEAGESMSYSLSWLFTKGVIGARMVTSQKVQTTCSDEQ